MTFRAGVVLLLSLLLLGAPAHADNDDLTAAQQDAWKAIIARVELMKGSSVDLATLQRAAKELEGLAPKKLRDMARYENLETHPEMTYLRLQQVLRGTAYLVEIGPHLDRAAEICLLLGHKDEGQWVRAIVEILREPFRERLGHVAEALSRDERGIVRAGAGRIAQYLNAFCGGRGSEWGDRGFHTGWNPTPLVRRIAERLLDDRNPAVACKFASDGYAFEDKTIIDMMVARIHDRRQMPRVPYSSYLGGLERTVGEACRSDLHGHFLFYRMQDFEMPDVEPVPALRRVTTLPADRSAHEIEKWWKQERARWSFRPDGAKWRTVIDDHFVLTRGKPYPVQTPYGQVSLHLVMYGESWSGHDPRFSIQVDARAADEMVYVNLNLGNPNHYMGYVSGGAVGSGGVETRGSIMYAPRSPQGVRARVRIWTCDALPKDRPK